MGAIRHLNPDDPIKAIGSRIRKARLWRDRKQTDVANALGVTRETVGTWERTGHVSTAYLLPLAEYLGFPAGWFLAGGDIPPTNPSGPGGGGVSVPSYRDSEVTQWYPQVIPGLEVEPRERDRAPLHLVPVA